MADRNPSKQRRQAQNRATREARKARAEAANTPVEERNRAQDPVDDKRSKRRRGRRDDSEVKARARAVIEADDEAIDEAIDEADDDIVADQDEPQAVAAAARRGASPVFSARHRSEIAASTAGKAPARTHAGVGVATGVAVLAATGPVGRAATTGQRTSSSTTRTSGAAKTGSGSRSGSSPKTSTSKARSTTGSTRRPPVAQKSSGRPLPAWLDRFGGNEPGGRAVMLSFVTVLVASLVLNFVHILPEVVEKGGKQVRTGRMFTIWQYGIGPGLYFLLPPILILGLFILTARPSNRRRSWGYALMSLVFITYVTGSIVIYFIPIACLGWGWWQARKAALDDVDGDPRVLREVERERRKSEREALRASRRR